MMDEGVGGAPFAIEHTANSLKESSLCAVANSLGKAPAVHSKNGVL